MWKNEGGYIVVETVVCFLLFVFLNISILSLINIVTVQARVHYALTQAAQTVSMYSYTLEAAGVAEHIQNSSAQAEALQKEANQFITDVDGVLDAIENLDLEGVSQSGQNLYEQGSGFVDKLSSDPKSVLQSFMNYGIRDVNSALLGTLIRPLVGRYLANGGQSGEEYLTAAHVIDGLDGLDFYTASLPSISTETNRVQGIEERTSRFLTSEGDIKLVVQYEIDYTFGALPLPFSRLRVTQEVMTKAWLNGAGEGYSE